MKFEFDVSIAALLGCFLALPAAIFVFYFFERILDREITISDTDNNSSFRGDMKVEGGYLVPHLVDEKEI